MVGDALDLVDDLDDESPDRDPDAPPALHVCDVLDDDEVCGATFDTANKLNAHRMGKHRIRADGSPIVRGERDPDAKRSRSGSQTRPKKPSRSKSSPTPPVPTLDRQSAYTSGLATIGLLLFLTRVIDDFDHGVINAGAPGLAQGLDAVGEKHPQVRAACDLILGGGQSGPYVQLLLAAFAIAVPIAAHHNAIPRAIGDRFSSLAGVSLPDDQPAARGPAPDDVAPDGPTFGAHAWTAEEWMNALQDMPPTVAAELAGRMMPGNGPTIVGVPFVGSEPVDLDVERGSEQLNPEPAHA